MKPEYFPSYRRVYNFPSCRISFLVFTLLLLTPTVVSDTPPHISIQVAPSYVGVGDTVVVTANASDDVGIQEIYFYLLPSPDFIFKSCGNQSSCIRSTDWVVDSVGSKKFCVKAIDTNNQFSDLACATVEVSLDRPPIIKYFYAQPTKEAIPTVHLDGTIKFIIVAEDNVGVKQIFFEDVSRGTVKMHECGSLKTCIFEYQKIFNETGVFEFCTWANDTADQTSNKSCIDVYVVSRYGCELITLDDTVSEKVIALRLTSKRLHQDRDGIIGYPAHCCRDQGFCDDLEIDLKTCENISGSFPFGEYGLLKWHPNETSVDELLKDYTYPQILCTNTLSGYTLLGVIDNAKYQLVGELQNLEENTAKYWTIETVKGGRDKYFFAEQLQQEENETRVSVIVDARAYSAAVHTLLEEECLEKDLESGECQFDCPDPEGQTASECDYSCLCGGGMALGCGYCAPNTCECCMQCHKLHYYEECIYRKYEEMYGRPYVDYLFCWRIPGLKDTPWCYQKSDQPTSTVNFPWYGFTRKEDNTYRSLDLITDEYIDEIHKWNRNVEVTQKPAESAISEETFYPKDKCDHNFESKLFRNVWVKVFTSTPVLHDKRNALDWTKTGPGVTYLGGGFRREPACWWECCRQCAPYCNCDCIPCDGSYCCLNAHYSPVGVTEVMTIKVPYTTISEGPISITPNNAEGTSWTVSNKALTIISTGNMPYTVSASFTKDAPKGIYTVNQVYTPSGGWSDNKNFVADYDQFVIAEDIVLNYTLKEDAKYFSVTLKEEFTTSLVVLTCNCVPPPLDGICPPGCGQGVNCCCCPSGSKSVKTSVSVDESTGSDEELDTIKINALKEASHGFVDIALSRHVRIGWVPFSTRVKTAWVVSLTDKAAELHEMISKSVAAGNTCIACGVNKARDLLKHETGEKYIIVMSDGRPNEPGSVTNAENAARAAVKAAASEGIIVHTVALGNDAVQSFMEELANLGNGTFHNVTCDHSLEDIYSELANSVNDAVVLVSDVSGSMSQPLTLNCPGEGMPVVHRFGRVNISITGNIDNYIDESITTGIRSKGSLRIGVNPDILNRFIFNVGNSSIDYLSLVYPVKHDAFRKEYVWGYWVPGNPYVIGHRVEYGNLRGTRTYLFNDSYGYETPYFNYPEQCREICPADCTCPKEDITDVTCIDKDGNEYKRTDCVCLPPKGHSYKTPCTSGRAFHEEEGYYFDFVDLETEEVSNITLMGKRGTNPVSTGDLTGKVTHNLDVTLGNVTPPDKCVEIKPTEWDIPESAVILPADPEDADADDIQKESLAVHGLAWHITYCAHNPLDCGLDPSNEIKVVRIIGPLTLLGVKYNAGPYAIITSNNDEKAVVDSVVSKYPVFSNVDYYELGSDAKAKAKPIFPVKVCIKDGAYDQPSKLFNEMHIPYSVWSASCLDNADLLIFGCPVGPLGTVTVDQVRDFVSKRCGSYVSTDWSIDDCNQIFPGYFTGAKAAHGTADLWEGSTGGSYDLPDDLKEFFQTPYETVTNWALLGGTVVVTSINKPGEVDVLARGDYSSGQTDKPMALTFRYEDGGRVFYYPVHIEGAASASQKAFMSSFYSSLSSSSGGGQGVVTSANVTYILDFEAMNFPYPLIRYRGQEWHNTTIGTDCGIYCRDLGLYALPMCNCGLSGLNDTCTLCVNATDINCSGNCSYACEDNWDSQQCCCAYPYFDLENADMTIFIHFRDNVGDQTFPLFPPHSESKPYANVYINVSMRNPSRVICEAKPDSAKPGSMVTVYVTLLDVLNSSGIPYEDVILDIEAYGISMRDTTDRNGKARFEFTTIEQSTGIKCRYDGGDKYTSSGGSAYVNVYSLGRFWWFLSPEVLLLLIILVLLAFSYKWFREGRLDIYDMWDELRGRK
ncbi:MAG: vWA domain-containing protein [Candidatus Altiarchaeota archaeon]|nr:vWA domain-containing protein [Candidatus Altiarchaeota archaeon]